MKNPLTFRVETWLGSVFVLLFSSFLVGWFFIAVKNFSSDAEILGSSGAKSGVKFRIISPEEKSLIDEWIRQNKIGVSAAEVGYRYIVKKFPDKPWLSK